MNGDESIKPFLEMRGIVKQFPGVLALNRVDFDLRPGEVHVLLGENGAGKSTLIKILSGVHTADEGEILLDGRPVHIRTPHDAKALGISTIFQEFTLVPDMSVAENIFLGRFPSLPGVAGFVDWKRMREESAALLRSLNVEVDPRTPVRQLGVAKQQTVVIGRWGIRAAINYLEGREVPKALWTPLLLVTKENVDKIDLSGVRAPDGWKPPVAH